MLTRKARVQLVAPFLLAALAGCDKAIYEVQGSGTATITYRDGQEQTEKNVALPWKKEVTGVSKLELKAVGSGMLECTITNKDGVSGHSNVGRCELEKGP